MSERLHIRYSKWDGSLHWHFDASLIDRDSHGTWVLVAPGGSYRRGDEVPRIDKYGFVVLVPDHAWWTAYFNAVPRGSNGHLVYIDINTPAEWDEGVAHLIDMDLDVTIDPSGIAAVIDEDELVEHSARFGYPADVELRVRATASELMKAVREGGEPFASAGFSRVASTLGWSSGQVVDGHGVASGSAGDPRFPNGTLAEQLPHFAEAGVPVAGVHPGTINADVGFAVKSLAPRATIADLTWHHDYPAEDFSFFDARIAVDGQVHDALLYRPHPDTKPEFRQPDTVVEILTPVIEGVAPGTPVSVWIDPSQAVFVTD